MQQPPLILVAGPTASGKSALALSLAAILRGQGGGTVINADSMQVYRDLRVLTARPTELEERQVPHRLYGIRDAGEAASAAWWLGEAKTAIAGAAGVPILCGGTGLYFQALLHGLAPVPEIPEEARAEARAMLEQLGAPALHARLAEVDPDTAAALRPGDSQRIARAWEVWRGTGRGLAQWQQQPAEGALTGCPVLSILLDPPRDALRAALRARWEIMLREGAVEEVRRLVARGLDPALPAMRAHGVPELAAVLRGDLTLAEAGERACNNIGRYTKRQATWFRHHALSPTRAHTIHARFAGEEQLSESLKQEILSFIDAAR
ncbi:tRNA (adenosine(37)-N6)-dimethylallyltransferase MiaA [Roseomonas elaeocarpi]|uniref:tRNA dimethylallyltransferase n=1 Tax=Roseomonas elaeocarpi TaxID=907779 RepID=A0ABV6JTM9_9PROT